MLSLTVLFKVYSRDILSRLTRFRWKKKKTLTSIYNREEKNRRISSLLLLKVSISMMRQHKFKKVIKLHKSYLEQYDQWVNVWDKLITIQKLKQKHLR